MVVVVIYYTSSGDGCNYVVVTLFVPSSEYYWSNAIQLALVVFLYYQQCSTLPAHMHMVVLHLALALHLWCMVVVLIYGDDGMFMYLMVVVFQCHSW